MQVNKWIYNNLSRYWREHCVLCGSSGCVGNSLCQTCLDDVRDDNPTCQRCALPLREIKHAICGSCQKSPPPYRSVYAFASYQAPLDQLIWQFKFRQKLSIGHKLGKLMAQDIEQRQLTKPDVVIPVPLHARRLRQRGYNQALELARLIAKHLNLPLDFNGCTRNKATIEQIGLPAKN